MGSLTRFRHKKLRSGEMSKKSVSGKLRVGEMSVSVKLRVGEMPVLGNCDVTEISWRGRVRREK